MVEVPRWGTVIVSALLMISPLSGTGTRQVGRGRGGPGHGGLGGHRMSSRGGVPGSRHHQNSTFGGAGAATGARENPVRVSHGMAPCDPRPSMHPVRGYVTELTASILLAVVSRAGLSGKTWC